MASSKVSLELVAEVKEALKGIQVFSSSATQSLQKVESNFAKIQSTAASLGGLLAGGALIAGLKSMVDASAQQEAAFNQMATSLKLAGDYSEGAVKSMSDFAAELQATSVVGDDLTFKMIALAKSFNLGNESAKKLVKAASNLAATTGQDLETSVKQLGMSFDGTAGRLQEMLPELRNFTAEQLKAGAAVDYINQRFGGAASEATKTFAGAMEQAKNSLGDIFDSLGSVVTKSDAVISAINGMTKAFTAMAESRHFRAIAVGVMAAAGAVATFVGGLSALALAIKTSTFVLGAFGVAAGATALPIVAIGAAVAGVIGGLTYLGIRLTETKDKFEILKDEIEQTKERIQDLQRVKIGPNAFPGQYAQQMKKAREEGIKLLMLQHELDKSEIDRARELTQEAIKENGIRAAAVAKEYVDKLKKEFESFAKSFKNIGLSEEQILGRDFAERIAKVEEFRKAGVISRAKAQEMADLAEAQHAKELGALREKLVKEEEQQRLEGIRKVEKAEQDRINKIKDAFANPFKVLFDVNLQGGEGFAASFMGMINQVLTYGTTAAKDARENLADSQAANREQLDRANAEIQRDFDESLGELRESLEAGRMTERTFREQELELTREYNRRKSDEQIKFQESEIKSQKDFDRAMKDARQQGAEGAGKILAGAASAAVNMIAPGFGEMAGGIVEQLAKGPEEAKAMVESIADGLSDAVVNIAAALPAVMETIWDKLPEIVERLSDAMPGIINSLADHAPAIITKMAEASPQIIMSLAKNMPHVAWALAKAMPSVAIALAETMVKAVITAMEGLVSSLLKAIEGGLKEIISKVIPGGSGGGGVFGVISGIGKRLGFAKGGEVPPGFANDTFPAALTSGELVVPKEHVPTFKEVMGEGSGGAIVEKLDQILDALRSGDKGSGNQNLALNLRLADQQVANMVFGLNRRGFRLA